uniref:WD_REPEATS_REGION domain-containing protein n=1 Tax=Syphacia muris TaxID=451379 RepID=A0A0N5AW51_9BILA
MSMNVGTEEGATTDYQTQEGLENGGGEGKSGEQRRAPYSMHGVLHFLQHEWSRFEVERSQWEMERAELQARISFLQGERQGQENLKADLVRRIKMLEYSLKQERAKNYRLAHNGQDPVVEEEEEEEEEEKLLDTDNQISLAVDAYANGSDTSSSFRSARELLRQYLQEIGYTETILDVRSFRAKNLLGLIHNDGWLNSNANSETRQAASQAQQEADRAAMEVKQLFSKKPNSSKALEESDSDEDARRKRGNEKDILDPETEDALGEFSFLKDEKISPGRKRSSEEWVVDQNAINQMKEKFRSEQERKRSNSQNESTNKNSFHQMFRSDNNVKKEVFPTDEIHLYGSKNRKDFIDINTALGITDEVNVEIKDEFTMADDDTSHIRWNLKFTLRSHFDSLRAMQFHPVEPVLITASEDGTAKLWNLGTARADAVRGSQVPTLSTPVTELEPTYTFRGHSGPILAMEMSPTGDMCYTGGFDGVICCWSIPSMNSEIYDPFDPRVLTQKLKGHTNVIWSLAYHSSDNRIISAGADGTIRLWDIGASEPLVNTYNPPIPNANPTSVDSVSTEPQQLVASYTGSKAVILDLETGRSVLSFDFSNDDPGLITKILSHPTMPVTVTGSSDRKIRYFDNNTGKLIHGTVAHVEAISSLAIDPNGLYLLSGSHDGSLRLWNMEKRVCLQEIAAHRKKFDNAVMSVAFHPSRPLIGSAGADGLAKVFTSQKYATSSLSDS